MGCQASTDSSQSLACRYFTYVQANAGIDMSLSRFTLKRRSPDALLIVPDAATLDLGDRIVARALRERIPVISTAPEVTAAGGLASYGVSRRENYRRAAYFIRGMAIGLRDQLESPDSGRDVKMIC